MKKNSSIKNLLPLFILLVASLVGYKYYEWKALMDLSNFQKESELEELSLIDKAESLHDDSYDEVDKFMTAWESSPAAEVKKTFWNLESAMRVIESFDKEYSDTIVQNKNELESFKRRGLFLIGKRRDFYKKYIESSLDYYNKEIVSANNNLVDNAYLLQVYEVVKDQVILSDFFADAGADEQYYVDNFGMVSSIKKYAKGDHAFEKEDEIRELRPKGFDYLDRNRKYFKDSYLLIKDMVAGDVESARYKAEAIDRSAAEFNFNVDEIFSETEEEDLDLAKKIAEASIEKIVLVHDFKNSSLVNYPVLESVDRWEENATTCNLYAYKTSIYNGTVEKYPDQRKTKEYIDELNQVLPDTSSVDKISDFSDFTLKNDEEKIEIECGSNTRDKTFTYTFKK